MCYCLYYKMARLNRRGIKTTLDFSLGFLTAREDRGASKASPKVIYSISSESMEA